jgi:hypothetical protein
MVIFRPEMVESRSEREVVRELLGRLVVVVVVGGGGRQLEEGL